MRIGNQKKLKMKEYTEHDEENEERSAYSDDESVANVMSELGSEDTEDDLQSQIDRITALVELVEVNRLNALLNYPLYGMLLHDLSEFDCLNAHASFFEERLQEYANSLDSLEKRLIEGALPDGASPFPISTLPDLINEMRMQDDFTKKNKKALTALTKELPDVKKTLEDATRIILGI